jgi:hypothetical protein
MIFASRDAGTASGWGLHADNADRNRLENHYQKTAVGVHHETFSNARP